MKSKINIAELLKDCPKGMELDCTMYDNIVFDYIDEKSIYPIKCRAKITDVGSNSYEFTKNGQPNHYSNAKCVIFPKGKTTWEGFHKPFVEGDIIYVDDFIAILSNITESGIVWYHCYYCNNPKIFRAQRDFGLGNINDGEFRLATEEEKQKLFDAIRENGYYWDAESKTLKRWTIQDAKDGDIVSYRNGWTCIFKCIHGICYSSYCFITIDGEFHTGYEKHEVSTTINGNVHLATKEQCDRLFQKMKEAGYKWNPETKTLEKLSKFKDGDILATNDGRYIAIIKENGGKFYCCCHINNGYFETDYSGWFDRLATEKEKQILFDAIRNNGYCWNVETKTLQHLFPYGIGTKVWVKSDKERKYIHTIVGISRNSFGNLEYEVKEEKSGVVVHYPKDLLIPITTKEFKFKVGDRIKYIYFDRKVAKVVKIDDKGYELDNGKFIEFQDENAYEISYDKFDFNTLKPFTTVLVRCSDNGIWNPQFFSRFRPKSKFPFECTYNSWIQCVPYEGNEYLWNTTDKCDEFYKIWEDE